VLEALGGRGYRAAQLDAGIRAGRVSLGGYARGLGVTGLTFYDDEVSRCLNTEEEPMICVAVGVDALRPSLRRTALGDRLGSRAPQRLTWSMRSAGWLSGPMSRLRD
jgi:hypothetical protein